MDFHNQDHDQNFEKNSQIFLPGNDDAYQKWRDNKLADHMGETVRRIVRIKNLACPTQTEIGDIVSQCAKTNLVIYELETPGNGMHGEEAKRLRGELSDFCKMLGLRDAELHRSQGEDGVVAIEVNSSAAGSGYIPYSDKALSWHTDGYYNAPNQRIKAVLLHCARDATQGGENELLDHEIAYIRLRDANRGFIGALMDDNAMTIPENRDPRSTYRAPSTGPVFFLDNVTGALYMRYSARRRNIIWREDVKTKIARDMLGEIMASDDLIVRHKLKPGQGVISNNVLHNRTGFKSGGDDNGRGRLVYRIRYMNRIGGGICELL